MAQGDYIYQGLSSLGDSIAAAIERKKQRDAFAQFQQTPSTVTQNPTTSNGDYAFGVEPTKTPNPAYLPAMLHYLSQSGASPQVLAQMSMQAQQEQMPKYQIQNDEGGGHTTFRTDFGQQPKVVEQQLPMFRTPPQTPDWSVANDPKTGQPVQMKAGNDILFKYTKPNPLNPNTSLEKWEKAGSTGLGGGSYVAVKNAMGATTQWVNPKTGDVVTPKDLGLGNMLDAPLTSTTKTMIEKAPKVRDLVQKMRSSIDAIAADPGQDKLGPLGSRWQQFMTGEVGASDPKYNTLRVQSGLLSTLLMNMHVGSRGSGQIMEKFDNLIGLGKQSPENLKAALDAIEEYANTVESEKGGISAPTQTKGAENDPLGILK